MFCNACTSGFDYFSAYCFAINEITHKPLARLPGQMSTNANTGQMNSNPRKIDTTWFSLCKSIPTEARIGGSQLALGDVHSFKATH